MLFISPNLFLAFVAVTSTRYTVFSGSSFFATDECWQYEWDKSVVVLKKVMSLQERLVTLMPDDVERRVLTCQYWNARIKYSQLRVKAEECPGNSGETLQSCKPFLQDDTNGATQNGCVDRRNVCRLSLSVNTATFPL